MVLAAEPSLFQQEKAKELPELVLSLSDGIRDGIDTFHALGMENAYTGNPAASNAEFGNSLFDVMCDMVITTVREHLGSAS